MNAKDEKLNGAEKGIEPKRVNEAADKERGVKPEQQIKKPSKPEGDKKVVKGKPATAAKPASKPKTKAKPVSKAKPKVGQEVTASKSTQDNVTKIEKSKNVKTKLAKSGGVHVAGYDKTEFSPVQMDILRGSVAHYSSVVVPALVEQFSYKTPMQVPRLVKLVVNVGLGEAKNNRAVLTDGVAALTKLAGQKAVSTKAKNSIAGFKIREEMPIGAMVTLRGARLYDFFVRLVHVALPRVKDFHGLKRKGFDGNGNLTIGIKDSSVFPELAGSYGTKAPGLSLTFVTTAKNNTEAEALFLLMGMPFVAPRVKQAS